MNMQKQPHGIPYQINIYEPDRLSDITSRGKHARALVFLDTQVNKVEIRVDRMESDPNLPMPTMQQLAKVANSWQRLHPPRTRLAYSHSIEEGTKPRIGVISSTWFIFEVVPTCKH